MEWPEVRKYLSSDAAKQEKKSNIMYSNRGRQTCLHLACYRGPPDDIVKAMIDIGGKELVMKIDDDDSTVLNDACMSGASYNIIKMLINVGGKDLVMAKSKDGDNALHWLCYCIKKHTKVAEKVKLILQVGDANLLLSTKDDDGNRPLEIAAHNGASNVIKKILTVQKVDLENKVEAQGAEISRLVEQKEKGEMDNTYWKDKADNYMNLCSQYKAKLTKQQAELHLLNNSSSDVEVCMKRKHTNEKHEEGEGTVVVQSQTQSSKRNKVENAAGISSGSFIRNQAEDDDDDLVNMLMSRHMALRKELRSAKAQIVELKQEIDDLAI
jgi:hypothetical protein